VSEWRKISANGLPNEGRSPKIRSSDGCEGDAVPLAAERWYDFHEFGYHLGNVGYNELHLIVPALNDLIDTLAAVGGEDQEEGGPCRCRAKSLRF
jgi:hypothetical protein